MIQIKIFGQRGDIQLVWLNPSNVMFVRDLDDKNGMCEIIMADGKTYRVADHDGEPLAKKIG